MEQVAASGPIAREEDDLMAIYYLLQSANFHPEHAAVIAGAFEDVCRDLGLAKRKDLLRDMVAHAILECASDVYWPRDGLMAVMNRRFSAATALWSKAQLSRAEECAADHLSCNF